MQDQRRWPWLKPGELERETESLKCTAQEQALRTNAVKMELITRTNLLYADSARRKSKVPIMFSVRVLSQLKINTGRDTKNLGKKCTSSCASNLKLNVKINFSRTNQSRCWRMTKIKYFRTLESRQIRKQNTQGQILKSFIKRRENAKSSAQLFLEIKTSK